jgi:DNA polymerase III sliding clamp (beta) subunit (PCNA family)
MRLINKKHLAVIDAASTDPSRYVLNGIKFEETEKGLRAIATDGRMMAIVESLSDDSAMQIQTAYAGG